jgi:hypothetical protein
MSGTIEFSQRTYFGTSEASGFYRHATGQRTGTFTDSLIGRLMQSLVERK